VIFGTFSKMKATSAAINPMIKVSLADSDGNTILTNADALIDTGSDACCVDIDFAEAHHLKIVNPNGQSSGATGDAPAKTYSVQIFIDGRWVTAECVSLSFQQRHFQFDLIVGMNLLSYFELSVNHSRGEISLSWAKL
jgi:predicted aspartyl protease